MFKKDFSQNQGRPAYCPPVSESLPLLTEGPVAVSNTEDIIDDPNKYGWN